MTEDAISFLGRGNAIQIKTPRYLTRKDLFIFLTLVDYFVRKYFLNNRELNKCMREGA